HLALLLCGDDERWDGPALARFDARYRGLVKVHRLANRTDPNAVQADARVLALLGAQGAAQYLVRPDGYIVFRCGGTNLDSLLRYLARWFPEPRLNVRPGQRIACQ